MAPSLQDGTSLVMSKLDRIYERGEIIVFSAAENDPTATSGESFYIKRIIGLPGDSIHYKDGNLYVNNKEVNQSFLRDSNPDLIKSSYEMNEGTAMPVNNYWSLEDLSKYESWNSWSRGVSVVPEGTVFVMGDHRSASKDSRYFGYVRQDTIKGVVKQMPFTSEELASVIDGAKAEFLKD